MSEAVSNSHVTSRFPYILVPMTKGQNDIIMSINVLINLAWWYRGQCSQWTLYLMLLLPSVLPNEHCCFIYIYISLYCYSILYNLCLLQINVWRPHAKESKKPSHTWKNCSKMFLIEHFNSLWIFQVCSYRRCTVRSLTWVLVPKRPKGKEDTRIKISTWLVGAPEAWSYMSATYMVALGPRSLKLCHCSIPKHIK